MANFTIISGDPVSGNLTFDAQSNNGNADVARGEHIIWNIASNAPNIDHISSIDPKPNNPNVFSDGPNQNGNSKNWQATVESNTVGIAENYTITWVTSTGITKWFDPKISVNTLM
jgi:hypothetical protein